MPFRYLKSNPMGYRSPKERDLKYENVHLKTKDGLKIHAWLISNQSETLKTILFFHGNAGNMGMWMDNIEQMVRRVGVNVLAIDYRGYGDSEGSPTEKGLLNDAEAALDFVISRKLEPYILGRSLGGAVAIKLAKIRGQDIKGIMVENTFTSISDMVDAVLPRFLAVFKPYLLNMYYPSLKTIKHIESPLLVISG